MLREIVERVPSNVQAFGATPRKLPQTHFLVSRRTEFRIASAHKPSPLSRERCSQISSLQSQSKASIMRATVLAILALCALARFSHGIDVRVSSQRPENI